MALTLTLTGSYPPLRLPPPPLTEDEVEISIKNTIEHQIQAIGDKPVQWLFVDGQPRNDIVSIFAKGLGLSGNTLPFVVSQSIGHLRPITIADLQIASRVADGRPLKAHITGPTLLAESCDVSDSAVLRYREGASAQEHLVLDFANALVEEVDRIVSQAEMLNLTFLQIDEPTLAYGADMELAGRAIGIITEVARTAGIGTILHVCGDIEGIMEKLLDFPVDILNVEGKYLRTLPWLSAEILTRREKKLAIGCMPVNTNDVPSVRLIERELLFAVEQFGSQNIWGITPDCGLRFSDSQLARQRMDRLVEVGLAVASRFGL